MEQIKEFIRRYNKCSDNDRLGNYDDDAWLKLNADIEEFWKTASDEEKKALNRLPLDSISMLCEGIKWEREQNK